MGISQKTIINKEDIINYIPQRNPIVMVDEFFGINENSSFSALTIEQNNIFIQDNAMCDSGIIEHIAQSAALRVGYIYKSKGENIPLGYIGAINNFSCYRLPKVNEKLYTTITVEQELMGITLISAIVTIDNQKVAECKMKIYIQQ